MVLKKIYFFSLLMSMLRIILHTLNISASCIPTLEGIDLSSSLFLKTENLIVIVFDTRKLL